MRSEEQSVFAGEFLVAVVFFMSAAGFLVGAVNAADRTSAVIFTVFALVLVLLALFVPMHRFYSHIVGSIVAALLCLLSVRLLFAGHIVVSHFITVPLMAWIAVYLAFSERRWRRSG